LNKKTIGGLLKHNVVFGQLLYKGGGRERGKNDAVIHRKRRLPLDTKKNYYIINMCNNSLL